MKCTTCGMELPPGAAFCPNCGTRTPDIPAAEAPVMAPPGSAVTSAPPPLTMPPANHGVMPPVAIPPGYYAPALPTTSTAAIVSLVFGILSWTLLPVISSIVAVIAGHMARNEIRRSGGRLGGDGLAVAGMIMGYVQIILMLFVMCAVVALGILTLLGSRVQS